MKQSVAPKRIRQSREGKRGMLMKRFQLSSSSCLARAVVVAFVVLVPAGVAWAGESGRCHSTAVSTEMVLPDGSVHEPGALTVCTVRTHSPIATLLKVSVDGHPVQMVVSRSGTSETEARIDQAFFVFHRNAEAQLVLQGYAVPARGKLQTYAMYPDRYEVNSTWELLAREYREDAPQDWPAVLIAALRFAE